MPRTVTCASFFDRVAVFLATGLGIGFIPWAPGTWGSLWGVLLGFWLETLPLAGRGVATLLLVALGIPICERAARCFGKEDPGAVVLDEIAAFTLVFAWVPVANISTAVTGFLLFRLFDIWKPWPIRWFEKLPGGVGIMADDLIAGFYAGAVLGLWNAWH